LAPVKFLPSDEFPKSVCAEKRTGTPATGFPAEVTRMTDRFRPFPATVREGASSAVAVVTFFAVVLVDVFVVVVVVVVVDAVVLPCDVEDVVVLTDVEVPPDEVVDVVVVAEVEVPPEVVVLTVDVVDDAVEDALELEVALVVDEAALLDEVVEDVVDEVVLPGSTTASQPFCMLSMPWQSMMQLIWNVPSVPAMNWIVDSLWAVSMTADLTEYPWTSSW